MGFLSLVYWLQIAQSWPYPDLSSLLCHRTSRLCLEAQPVLLRMEGAPPLECLPPFQAIQLWPEVALFIWPLLPYMCIWVLWLLLFLRCLCHLQMPWYLKGGFSAGWSIQDTEFSVASLKRGLKASPADILTLVPGSSPWLRRKTSCLKSRA